jgi:hypothetical protein
MIAEPYFWILLGVSILLILSCLYFSIKSIKSSEVKNVFATVWDYLQHFGWLFIGGLIVLTSSYLLIPNYFHLILLVLIFLLLVVKPLKFIYILVGGKNSLRTFFILFIFTQLAFSALYCQLFKDDGDNNNNNNNNSNIELISNNNNIETQNEFNDSVIKPEVEMLTKAVIDLTEQIKALQSEKDLGNNNSENKGFDYSQILLNTFLIALIQECSPLFEQFIEEKVTVDNKKFHNRFYTILNIQIFISWLYLGVLIASLYHKITKQ